MRATYLYRSILIFVFFMISGLAFGSSPEENNFDELNAKNTDAKFAMELIDSLESDGLITKENAFKAKSKYIFNAETKSLIKSVEKEVDDDVSWVEYISLVNIIKLVATIFILIALKLFIFVFLNFFIVAIKSVPTIVYQSLLLSGGLFISIMPELISESEVFYLALFGSFVSLFSVVWMLGENNKLVAKFFDFMGLKESQQTIFLICFAIYFGAFAIEYESSVFGLLSVVGLVGATGFFISKVSSGVILYIKDDEYIPIVGLANFIILFVYSVVMVSGFNIMYIEYFSVGIEYVCSLALAVSLVISASPWYKTKGAFFVCALMFFVLSSILSLLLSVFYNIGVPSAFINTFFVFFVMEWLGYYSKRFGMVVATSIVGFSLYGFALVLEKYPQYFVSGLI